MSIISFKRSANLKWCGMPRLLPLEVCFNNPFATSNRNKCILPAASLNCQAKSPPRVYPAATSWPRAAYFAVNSKASSVALPFNIPRTAALEAVNAAPSPVAISVSRAVPELNPDLSYRQTGLASAYWNQLTPSLARSSLANLPVTGS